MTRTMTFVNVVTNKNLCTQKQQLKRIRLRFLFLLGKTNKEQTLITEEDKIHLCYILVP